MSENEIALAPSQFEELEAKGLQQDDEDAVIYEEENEFHAPIRFTEKEATRLGMVL